jgi:hypothetical protein
MNAKRVNGNCESNLSVPKVQQLPSRASQPLPITGVPGRIYQRRTSFALMPVRFRGVLRASGTGGVL